MSKDYYATSIQHLLAELKRIDVLIITEIEINRQQISPDANMIKMYGISDDEINTLIRESIDTSDNNIKHPYQLNNRVIQFLEKQKNDIVARRSGSIARKIPLRLERLRELYALSPDEIDILLISLTPEIHNKYQRFFGYLQDDKTQIRPSVDLILRLLQTADRFDPAGKLKKYNLFADKAPLIKKGLVHLQEEAGRPGQPLLNRVVMTDERIRDYLLGSDIMAREIDDCAGCYAPQVKLDDLLVKDEFKARLLSLMRNTDFKQECVILYLQGGYGTGKQAVAECLCASAGLKLLAVDLSLLVRLKPNEFSAKILKLAREAELQTAALLINDFDLLIPGRQEVKDEPNGSSSVQDESLLNSLMGILTRRHGVTFFAGNAVWEPKRFAWRLLIFSYPDTLSWYA